MRAPLDIAAPPVKPVPPWMQGLWRRRSIAYADGRCDDQTIVYWLQTESAFADIRIPADRPPLRDRGGLASLDESELLCLARQAGFAGTAELDGDRCRWTRAIDFQPPSGTPDEGRLHLADGLLVEEGVHEPYVELWEPVDCGPGRGGTYLFPAARGSGDPPEEPSEILVVWGDVFLFARGRSIELPRAPSLGALVRAATGGRAQIAPLLDCELSLGSCRSGRVPFEIRLSTLPEREGRPLAAAWTRGDLAC